MARTFVWHRSRGPQHTPKALVTDGNVEIRQVRSGIGHSASMRRTLEAIGLKHHQDVVVRPYSASLAGQIKHVRHLVTVTPVAGEASLRPARTKAGVSPAGDKAEK